MELKDYTVEELKAELKRRAELKKQAMAQVARCRNCRHLVPDDKGWCYAYKCGVRTFTMHGRTYHYTVSPSKKACDMYEKKVETK